MIGGVKVALIPSSNASEKKTTVQDMPQDNTLQSKGRHSTVSHEELSEPCQIGLEQAREIIFTTTQRLTRSVVMPLARQYKADRVFHTKNITGMWAIDTMDGRVIVLYGNLYAQVFSNGTYFVKIYPMAKKADAGQAVKTFVVKLSFTEELRVDG